MLGWPREVKAAWDATALNLAVYRGDAQMAELLLESGADWQTRHGYGSNVVGTLSYASQNDPRIQRRRGTMSVVRGLSWPTAYRSPNCDATCSRLR